MRDTPHVLEVGLFLVISAELRAIQLARGRAPCTEILLERSPTVGAAAGSSLDRQVADHNHHASPRGAHQRGGNLLKGNLKVHISYDLATTYVGQEAVAVGDFNPTYDCNGSKRESGSDARTMRAGTASRMHVVAASPDAS
jgi:hypothetical protein